jgi:integrase
VPLKTLLDEQWTKHEALAKKGRICPYVFSRGGKPIKNLDTAWRNARKAAGCPDRVIHDLRRTAVRNLIRAGVTEHVAMMLSGHLTSSVFRRYDIIADSDLVAAAEKLQAASDR